MECGHERTDGGAAPEGRSGESAQAAAPSPDALARATSRDGSIAVMSVVATRVVRDAIATRPTSTTAAAVLGRLLMGALLLAASKKDAETVQIQLSGNGPLGTVTAIADGDLRVRGTLAHREAEVPRRADGRPDTSAAVGRGLLSVVRHHPRWREPYSGIVPMTLRDIAKDLTRYLLESEQAPSALGLSIEHDEAGHVVAAAGFLVQALPGADDSLLAELEANVKALPRAAGIVAGGGDAHALLHRVAGGIELGEPTVARPRFVCPCDRGRAARALQLLRADELREMIAAGAGQEVECQFCGTAYQLGSDEIRRALEAVESTA